MRLEKNNPTPTVSRVIKRTIVELVYDKDSRKTALVAATEGACSIVGSFVADTGETFVPYSAANNLIRHECVLFPSHPEPSGGKDTLVEDISAYLHRYVQLSPLFERIAAYYVLLSWVFDAFNEVPYLRFRGDYGSGKTRALIATGSIAYRGFFASGASTVSPIFHTLDNFGGTLVLDEADLRFSDKWADLVKILNNGTVRGMPVLRSVQNRTKEFDPAAFSVYGPKIVAMRGSFKDKALESRFLTEDMSGRALREDIPIQLPDSLGPDALALRNRLLHFRLTKLLSIRADPSRAVKGIDPRLNQMGLSLLSLIDDGMLRDEVADYLRRRAQEMAAERTDTPEARTISAAMEALSNSKRPHVPIHEIAARAGAAATKHARLSVRDVGRILRDNSFELRKSNGTIVVAQPRAN